MTPTEYEAVGREVASIVHDYDRDQVTIFGRKFALDQAGRDRMIADSVREAVIRYNLSDKP
jgi:hypothetical protein